MTDYSNINMDNLDGPSAEKMVKIAQIDLAARLFGDDAARQLWEHLGLPRFAYAQTDTPRT